MKTAAYQSGVADAFSRFGVGGPSASSGPMKADDLAKLLDNQTDSFQADPSSKKKRSLENPVRWGPKSSIGDNRHVGV